MDRAAVLKERRFDTRQAAREKKEEHKMRMEERLIELEERRMRLLEQQQQQQLSTRQFPAPMPPIQTQNQFFGYQDIRGRDSFT
jgi:hypothetical protein